MDTKNRKAELTHAYALYGLQLIKITFPFDKEDISKVKTLQERRYVPDDRCWVCKFQLENIEKLKQWGFELDQTLESTFARSMVSAKDVKEIVVPGLREKLFPFQSIGVAFIEAKNGRALVADEMGLGKTVQALAWLQLHPELRPAIIVVPASLKLNWLKESRRWMSNPKAIVLSGTKTYPVRGEIVIINYDILSYWWEYLHKLMPKVLILDEIHSIKNSGTKRTKAVKKLAKGVHHIIGLSGTPIVNRPIEMYNALTLIDSSVIPNYKEYTRRYCGAKYNGFGWDYNGATNTDELHSLLKQNFMIRRKKLDVLKDLPEKRSVFVPIELENIDEYEEAENDFIAYVRKTKGVDAANRANNAETLTKINLLKQLVVKGKLKGCIDWISEYLESGEKLIVFCTHIDTINQLMNAFPKVSVRYDGEVSQIERDKAVEKFQTKDDCILFIGMLDTQGKPAGLGITLTASWATATVEYQWSPGVHDQADDRTNRIGQKNACINYKLIAPNSIEEKIALLIDQKRMVLDSILDGKKTDITSLLSELIKQII